MSTSFNTNCTHIYERDFLPLDNEEYKTVRQQAMQLPENCISDVMRKCIRSTKDLDISLEFIFASWLAADIVMLGSKSGEMLLVRLNGDSNEIRTIDAASCAILPISPCCGNPIRISKPKSNQFYLPTLFNQSKIIKSTVISKVIYGLFFVGGMGSDSIIVRVRLISIQNIKMKMMCSLQIKQKIKIFCSFHILNIFFSYGSINDLCIAKTNQIKRNKQFKKLDQYVPDNVNKNSFIACSGGLRQGSIVIFKTTLDPYIKDHEFNIVGAYAMWALEIWETSHTNMTTNERRENRITKNYKGKSRLIRHNVIIIAQVKHEINELEFP
jgi:hypothetical protein